MSEHRDTRRPAHRALRNSHQPLWSIVRFAAFVMLWFLGSRLLDKVEAKLGPEWVGGILGVLLGLSIIALGIITASQDLRRSSPGSRDRSRMRQP